MRMILACFLYLASFFVPPFAFAQEGISLPHGNFEALRNTGIARVNTVISPYSIQLDDGRIIRPAGLEFPDMNFNAPEPGGYALTATEILRDLLEGQEVNIYQTTRKDRGRTNRMRHHLAHLERRSDKAWLQGTLLTLGLARVQTTQRNPEMAAQMYELEAAARAQKIGLWEDERYQVRRVDDAQNYLNSLQIIEGRVRSAALRKNTLYLNFGPDWRSDFTLSISGENRRRFTKQGLDPLNWAGTLLRVRGWVRKYNGPFIEIDNPESIEILTKKPMLVDTKDNP